jgi:CPA1 family monovalent cation:H+ antiporter
MLIGLQLPAVTAQLGHEVSMGEAIGYGVAISLVLIVCRLACTFGASLFTRFISHFITVADPRPGWKGPIIYGWAGMRGVVSLAAALSIPLLLEDGQAFPFRNLILFITFVVILITLVLQGLSLPWLIRKLNLEDRNAVLTEQEQELILQKKMAHASLQLLQGKYHTERGSNEHLNNLFARLELELKFFQEDLEVLGYEAASATRNRFLDIYLEVLEQQREVLYKINRRSEFDEELIRKYLGLIDFEEFKVREKVMGEWEE